MLDVVHDICRRLPGSRVRFPFGPTTVVYSVEQRMFALVGLDHVPPRLNLKCDPARAIELREQYPAITAGYHMNKRHWNTVLLDGSVPQQLVEELIVGSYRLVVGKLPRQIRALYLAQLDRLGIGR
ncbi:MAG: MmcQ/YjbR family DNA-binding protein [Chlorobi bacterium]|nr:MmcQ/YjbR family DNA-binding protein [Chlorobiota bacterium]